MTLLNVIYQTLILNPVQRWYLRPLASQIEALSEPEQRAVLDQAVIGWLQTLLLIVAVVQGLFAGVLAALPPSLRSALSFLHRVEWAVYIGILLVGLQAARGFAYRLIVTNRFFVLGWRLGRMQIVRDGRVNRLVLAYLLVMLLMIGALLFVSVNGFLVRPLVP